MKEYDPAEPKEIEMSELIQRYSLSELEPCLICGDYLIPPGDEHGPLCDECDQAATS